MPRHDPFAVALAALDAGRGVAVATVVGAHGSTPRHLGARMVVAADGEQWGTIGGGRIEQVVVERAQEVARGAAPEVVRHHLVRDLAMCCGGSMEIALTPMRSREVLVLLQAITAPTMLVTPIDGGPWSLRAPREPDPRAHQPRVVDGALVERLGAVERAIIFGLGHVARSLGPLLASVGFRVIACDDGETGATATSPAWASELVESFDPREVEARVGGFGADDYVLIVTRDHAVDQKVLEVLIAHEALGYLGMIGSRGKVGRFEKRLRAKGLLEGERGEQRWARLRAPIGLDLGAETPEEIAVAIAAELIARRRRGSATPGDWAYRRHHAENDA